VTAPLDLAELEELASGLNALARRFEGRGGLTRYGRGSDRADDPLLMATNAVTGVANPVAPPMRVRMERGVAIGSGVFGPAYEGAPGCVHGGYLAAVLESLLPRPAARLGKRLTGTMAVRYRRPTPVGERVCLRAELASIDGRKARTIGTVSVGGSVTVEAEALVIGLAPDGVGPS
jgi:hypothetical protein